MVCVFFFFALCDNLLLNFLQKLDKKLPRPGRGDLLLPIRVTRLEPELYRFPCEPVQASNFLGRIFLVTNRIL